MEYLGYVITGIIAFILGVLATQLALHFCKVKKESKTK